jgi:hypothetical protein
VSYEFAPATTLLASHCAACGRPLVDAQSVETGMGPECRSKYGVPDSIDEAARVEANALVYAIAIEQTGANVALMVATLRGLGCEVIADRITKRIAPLYTAVMADDGAGYFTVKASYDVAMAAGLGVIPGRRWVKETKLNRFPVSAKREVFDALRHAFPGGRCMGARGEFTL